MAERAETRPRQTTEKLWGLLMLEGVSAVFFGATAIFWPSLTLMTLVYLVSALFIALGLTKTVKGVMGMERRSTWWLTLVVGLGLLGSGTFLARNPDVKFKTFVLVAGLTLVGWGIVSAVRVYVEGMSLGPRVLSWVANLAAVVAGIIVLSQPEKNGLGFVWVLGLYGLVFGVLSMALGASMRDEER